MDASSALSDYKLFIKKNRKLILGSTIALVVVLTLAVIFFVTRPEQQTIPDEDYVTEEIFPQIEVSADLEELSSAERELLSDYLNKGSQSFRIYVETNDSEVFTDYVLLKEVLIDENLTQEITQETGSELLPIPELAVSVFQISGSEMLQIKVGTGNTAYNRDIINYYYQYINNGNIPFFDDKNVFYVDAEPFSFEEVYGLPEEEQQEELSFIQNLTSNIEVILIVIVLGILAGLILGTFIAIIKESLAQKIPSIYNFNLYPNSKLVSLDAIPLKTMSNPEALIVQAIAGSTDYDKLVLSEKKLDDKIKNNLTISTIDSSKGKLVNVKNIEDIQLGDVEEIVILVKVYETSKKWFEKQMEQTKSFDIPVKIIRLPIKADIFVED